MSAKGVPGGGEQMYAESEPQEEDEGAWL